MKSPEFHRLVARLRLSAGDVLSLARDVAQDASLCSADLLSERQQATLMDIMRLMAEPMDIERYSAQRFAA